MTITSRFKVVQSGVPSVPCGLDTKRIHAISYVACIILLISSSVVFAQETHDPEKIHQFKRFRISLSIGHCYIPRAEFTNDEQGIVLPTWGLDLQYWFSEKVGIGLKNDIENAVYRVRYKSSSSDELLRERPVIISLPIFVKPWNKEFNFFIGPGVELEESANLFVVRIGVSYEYELGQHWDFAPEIIYDLKGSSINAFTICVGVGRRL